MDIQSAYAISFAGLAHETRYSGIDVKALSGGIERYEVDARANMFGVNNSNLDVKALNSQTGGAGTAGYALVPVYVDPKIIDQTRKYTPLCEIIPRVSNLGMTADYNVITAKGGGFTAAEDSALAEKNNAFARRSQPIKFLYAVGRVTGPARASIPAYALAGFNSSGSMATPFGDSSAPNAKQLEVLLQARALKELEENLIINGDADTDATQFSGLIKLIGATNTVDKNTSDLGLEDINTAIQYAFDDGGRPSLAVCSSAVYSDILGLLQSKVGYMQAQQQVLWGFQSIVLHTMTGPITVIPSMFMSNTTGQKAIYFLDLSVVEMRVLQDMVYEELAKTNDSEKFMLKIYETLIVRNPAFCSSITEIK